MKRSELLDLIAGGENSGVEFKRDDLRREQLAPRNLLISETLRDYGYADARGMGVRNKIIPLMRAHNGVDPAFEATEDYVRLTLHRGAAPRSRGT